jgi:RecA/RadA recombinase
MTLEIIGNYPPVVRANTKLWSFDRAIGNPFTAEWGVPLRSLIEIFGPPESGKTSLGYTVAAAARDKGHILLASIEFTDKKYLENVMRRSGFQGTVEFLDFHDEKGKWLGHAKLLTDAVNRLGREEDIVALILDSVASIVPPAREDSIIGEGFMADRAKFMKDMCSRVEAKLMNRETPATFIALNHVTQSLDPANRGHITPGGTGLKFHGVVRVYMFRKEVFPTPKDTDKSRLLKGFVAEGHVEKLRFGGRGRRFRVYIVPGVGVHKGMTAMFDCIAMKLGERNQSGTISLGGSALGRIGSFVEAAYTGKEEKFEPFLEELADYNPDMNEGESDDTPAEGVETKPKRGRRK